MNTIRAAASTFLVTLSLPLFLAAKGPTLKITIKGAAIARPIEITDPNILAQFNVWEGAGVQVNNVPQDHGFIINWGKGVVAEPPNGLRRYEVSFHVMHQGPSVYIVSYAYDPATDQGCVYLPGGGESYNTNTFLIYRGIEGNWFRATSEWTNAVTPLIEKA